MYRPIIYRHGHQLANEKGAVRESRFVLFEKLNGSAGKCHWCSIALTWKTLCADHLDSNVQNNVPKNLVGSCRGCNANREDGTGHGRLKPKKCPECEILFIAKSHHNIQIYCSEKCAQKNRPRPGTKSKHGTRTRYVFGCRCNKCRYENSRWWREKYGK